MKPFGYTTDLTRCGTSQDVSHEHNFGKKN